MRILTILSLKLLFFSFCAFAIEENQQDLIGTWIINHDTEEVNYSFIEYEKSGDKCEISFSLVNSLEVDMYWNKWELIDGVIHSTLHNTTTFMEFAFHIQDKVLKLNHSELFVDMLIPKGEYSTEYHYKNHQAKPGQVCNVVKKFFKNKSKIES
ncbi:hypothetical protein Q4574_04580 [Aliiglaciecola sp. 3_MG-2023]|uniref:hypothetical protein n=1 Tax=Aliiglaciecola sp. 3_MG-2023 TaxID=3062644 RepID=UPI0026E3A04B|nr:hypothetical protein [Aliiglaciecola sp. 3_MG-2023]MDO6692547.1 hypothetical protein [Aliiglaciecola sp. 3_MG-2023]